MGDRIHVEEEGLINLKRALETAGADYKNLIDRLSNLMDEITSGDIQGDPAVDLLTKYREKESDFKVLSNLLEELAGYLNYKGTDFEDFISGLKSRQDTEVI